MGRIATNTIKQIEILRERGMELDFEEKKVKEILLDIGYYRLGFYWYPFQEQNSDNFRKGTKFSDVVNLYYLDVDLRNILQRYINRIEINFRTKLVYYVSNKYKSSPTWFIDSEVMQSNFIDTIENHYTDEFKNNNKLIKLHHKKYINDKYAPAWKTLEFFTFGAILKIYKSLKNEKIKERISNEYDIRNVKKFINIMGTIVFVRNTCAHGGVLFDFATPKGISILPSISFNNNNRHSLDSAIKIILFIVNKISHDREQELKNILTNLFEKHKDNKAIKDIIINNIGYKYQNA